MSIRFIAVGNTDVIKFPLIFKRCRGNSRRFHVILKTLSLGLTPILKISDAWGLKTGWKLTTASRDRSDRRIVRATFAWWLWLIAFTYKLFIDIQTFESYCCWKNLTCEACYYSNRALNMWLKIGYDRLIYLYKNVGILYRQTIHVS